jgi:hypothetical protein
MLASGFRLQSRGPGGEVSMIEEQNESLKLLSLFYIGVTVDSSGALELLSDNVY